MSKLSTSLPKHELIGINEICYMCHMTSTLLQFAVRVNVNSGTTLASVEREYRTRELLAVNPISPLGLYLPSGFILLKYWSYSREIWHVATLNQEKQKKVVIDESDELMMTSYIE